MPGSGKTLRIGGVAPTDWVVTENPGGGLTAAMGVRALRQLTEFLTVVAGGHDAPAARRAAVQHAAAALGADVAAIVSGGTVTVSAGDPANPVPADDLVAAATGTPPGSYAVGAVAGPAPAHLVLARSGGAFTDGELTLVSGMAEALGVILRSLDTLESERRQADRLVGDLRERRRLLEHLAAIRWAVARREPLPQILDGITAGARELLGAATVGLTLIEDADPSAATLRSGSDLPPGIRAATHPVPLPAAGVAGQAMLHDELVQATGDRESPSADPAAAMAVPVHGEGAVIGCLVAGTDDPEREWDKHDQDVLRAFAEHAGLAVSEAKALAATHRERPDPLTGLAGRALFISRLEEASTSGSGGSGVTGVTALLIDLDRFTVVNDSFGHAAGDLLLAAVADRIRNCLRAGDLAARLGGDEFAVLMPGTADDAVLVAQRILAAVRAPFDLDGREAYVTGSAGIASAGAGEPGGSAAQRVMLHADLAMDRAKKLGKDRYELFGPDLLAAFRAGRDLESDLRRAVLRNEFRVRYQPIVRLAGGAITGLEALVRWQHPTRGLIPPLDFVPLAEETGMIVGIGEFVLREACRQVARWNAHRRATLGPGTAPLSISVNLSAVQLEQPGLPDLVADVLARTGLPPACLVLELTESVLVAHGSATAGRLSDLKALGVRLAIDDFGTGYSSLAYLRQFPVDIIKIDKSFVDDVGDVPAASALTEGIIQLGQALALSTVAEGIEDAAQLDRLTRGRCELGQGFYFARPLDETGMSELLLPPP